MALAPLAHVLFTRILNYDAKDPSWPDRDRFILSAGHASILHYSMLYLTGQGLELDDLRQFRQIGSMTPGHPEAGHTAGIEVTTGPLGQGLANGVGMAMTERYLRSSYGEDLCDHYTYVIAGDGCLSEGISHEAASFAGHQQLGRLVVVYDDNHITIDGSTDLSLSDDAPGRFASYGWDVDEIGEVANDLDALTAALERAKTTDRPSLIVLRSHIGNGRQIYFGVREHAMGSTMVGAAKHGGVVPIGGTFLVFADYMRPPVRLAAMSEAKCVFVWTHDSLGVGEDGPTHQPVEQIMSLRAIPGLRVIRPGDAIETAGAWKLAMEHDGPSAMILSRQDLPVLASTDAEKVSRGGYAVIEASDPDLILIGTGSELAICVDAAEMLAADGVSVRVVSLPCWEAFETLPAAEQHAVIDPSKPRISIEAGVTLGWNRYADVCLGIDRFGASGPGAAVLDKFGMNTDNVLRAAKDLLG
ncbi:UNVERIFIED_CONTAM: hypothetical protein GTU68_013458 [Idotea baltica]|nr:hypothetical protein [Idotea baltica]